MARKVLIELHQQDDYDMSIDDQKTDIAFVNVKVYDRDGIGLPPIIVLQESEKNKSLNIQIAMDMIEDNLIGFYRLEPKDVISFQETKEGGLMRVQHATASWEMTPAHQEIKTRTNATAGDIEREISRGLASAFARDEKIELSEQSNLPTLESIGLKRRG